MQAAERNSLSEVTSEVTFVPGRLQPFEIDFSGPCRHGAGRVCWSSWPFPGLANAKSENVKGKGDHPVCGERLLHNTT